MKEMKMKEMNILRPHTRMNKNKNKKNGKITHPTIAIFDVVPQANLKPENKTGPSKL